MDDDVLGHHSDKAEWQIDGEMIPAGDTVLEYNGQRYRRCAECLWWYLEPDYFYHNERTGKCSSYCHRCEKDRAREAEAARFKTYRANALRGLGDVCRECGEDREILLDVYPIDPELRDEQKSWNRRRRYNYVVKHTADYQLLCKNCGVVEATA